MILRDTQGAIEFPGLSSIRGSRTLPLEVSSVFHTSDKVREKVKEWICFPGRLLKILLSVMHQNFFFLFLFLSKMNVPTPLGHFLLLHCLSTSSSYKWYFLIKWHAKAFLIHLSLNLIPCPSIHIVDRFQAENYQQVLWFFDTKVLQIQFLNIFIFARYTIIIIKLFLPLIKWFSLFLWMFPHTFW